MSNAGDTPAGWYHAPGDPEGTQRYWDGAQWVGDPQAVPQQAPAEGFGAPVGASPSYGTPAASGSAVPSGYQPLGGASASGGVPADYGQRVVAYLIDFGIIVVGYIAAIILIAIGSAVSDVIGVLLAIVAFIGVFGFAIWNLYIRQGSTGQTIGKSQQNIKLIKDDTQQPPGGGMTFVRYLVGGLLSSVTCGIYGLLDILWPLWDEEKKRLTDKIMKMSVVKA